MNVFNIVGSTGNKSSNRIVVKEGQGKVLEVGEDLHSQVMHDPLTDEFHQIDLSEVETEGDDQDGEEDEKYSPAKNGLSPIAYPLVANVGDICYDPARYVQVQVR